MLPSSVEDVHEVAVVAVDGVLPLDLGIPVQLFAARAGSPYRVQVCAAGRVVRAYGGFDLTVAGGPDDVAAARTVVVVGYLPALRPVPASVLAALSSAAAAGARMVSICTGAFALAAAGLLTGRRATTHWQYTDALAAMDTEIDVDPDVLYVDEGSVLTSAGVCCGIDLCLHLIRRDLGAEVASEFARSIVAAPHRDGGQAQYIRRAVSDATQPDISAARQWALQHLDDRLTVTELAEQATLSPRTFARRFVAETGMPPHRWLTLARIERARELLEDGEAPVAEIARRCGLGSPASLRAHLRRELDTTPTAYRRAFGHRNRPT